jgi:cytochrome P450
LQFQRGASTPRSGVFSHACRLGSVPKYMLTVHALWERCAKAAAESAFAELWKATIEGAISRAEAILLIIQCLVSMTTANALVNTIVRLLENDSLYRTLMAQTSERVLFINEVLRVDAPLQRLPRRVLQPTHVFNTKLPVGSSLMLLLGAANCPIFNTLQPRQDPLSPLLLSPFKPRVHTATDVLTFGWGLHRCLGEELVRLELRLALNAWLSFCPAQVRELIPGKRLTQVDVGNFGFEHVWVRF